MSVLLTGAAGRPALVDAVRSGEISAVRALIEKKADVNAAEGDGATALHWAAYRDDLAMTDLLLRAGANVNAANDLGATPLWLASENGSGPIVQRLLRAGANPNLALMAGETPLMAAARGGFDQVVAQLIAKGAVVNARAKRGQTALMWAVAQKHPGVVKVLLAHGADLHAKSDAWNQVMAVPPHGRLEYNRAIPQGGDTALLFAAHAGDLESARLLVAAGANVNDADAWGITPAVFAAHSGFSDLLGFLLDKGANPNAAAAGFTALHAAIMRRDQGMVSALLSHGADPNASLQTWTPTRRSSRDWNFAPELVGASPLWLAARLAEPGLMQLLLDRGADARFVHHASYHAGDPAEPRSEVLTIVMAAVGIGGAGGEGGMRAWVRPAGRTGEPEGRVLEVVKLAVAHGVDLNVRNVDGRTALDGARAMKYAAVVKFLEENGAKSGKTN